MSFIVFYQKLVRGLLLSWKLCLNVGDEVDVDFRCWLCQCLYFVGNPLFCHFANVQKWQIEVVWNVSLVKNQATTIVRNKWWPYPKLHQIELGMSGIVKQFKCAHCQGSKWIFAFGLSHSTSFAYQKWPTWIIWKPIWTIINFSCQNKTKKLSHH